MSTMMDTAREMQTRYLENVKTAQEQIVAYNEQIAETIVTNLPEWNTPFADRLPKPAEVIESYYSFVGELQAANKAFAKQMVKAWERPEPTEA